MTTITDSLEDLSLWYRYKTAVWYTETPQAVTIHNIMRTIRAIHLRGGLAYVSAPITSGYYLYRLKLDQPQLSTADRIRLAIAHNYDAGDRLTQALVARLDIPVLYPADLTPIYEMWEQEDFQALWLSIIAEKCTELHMSEGWEYSNGGCEEFVHVWQLRLGIPRVSGQFIFFNTRNAEAAERERMRQIQVFDHRGNPLTLDDGLAKMHDALEWMAYHHLSAPKINRCVELLASTKSLLAAGFYQ